MLDNDFMDCPSPTAEGRHDRCGQFASPRRCWNRSCSMPDAKPTPNPSITVGTQVRLTGVIRRIEEASGEPPYTDWVAVKIDGSWESPVGIAIASVEVIRQPFKRGEVVWNAGGSESDPYVVLNDEYDGKVDVTDCETGETYRDDNASGYERRPFRPKEER